MTHSVGISQIGLGWNGHSRQKSTQNAKQDIKQIFCLKYCTV